MTVFRPPSTIVGFPQIVALFVSVGSMAVPKRRQSNQKSGSRRAHDQKKPKQLHYCPKCSTALPSHVICPNCGYYMGRTVVEMEDKTAE